MDPSSASLAGRTALVTGAGAGHRHAASRCAMAAFGARVAVLDLNPETAERTAAEITARAAAQALAVPADARDPDAVEPRARDATTPGSVRSTSW